MSARKLTPGNKSGDFDCLLPPADLALKATALREGEEGGGEPIWSADGTELFYRAEGKTMVVSIETEAGFRAGRPRVLFEGPYVSSSITPGFAYYDVTPDGQRFLIIQSEEETAQINVILNWFEELKRLAPTDN